MAATNIKKELKTLVCSVNESLVYFEKDYISVQRCPIVIRERTETLRHYLECRFNFEAFNSPSLRPYAEYFDGYLFDLVFIQDPDEKKRIYTEACVELCKDPTRFLDEQFRLEEEGVTYLSVIDELTKLLGGTRIYFNKSSRIPKIRIE